LKVCLRRNNPAGGYNFLNQPPPATDGGGFLTVAFHAAGDRYILPEAKKSQTAFYTFGMELFAS